MKNSRFLGLLLAALSVAPASAFAQEEEAAEGELVERVAVRNRLYSVDDRFEIGASIGFTLMSRLTEHYNFNATVGWNIAETFALEIKGGFAYSQHTAFADRVAVEFERRNPLTSVPVVDDLRDLWEMTANAVVGVRWQPIYGKLGLMAELPIHFQFYVWAGGGAGLFKKQSLVICNERQGNVCNSLFGETQVGPLVSVALGGRFFITQRQAVRLELRDYSYLDSYRENINRAAAVNPSTPDGNGTVVNAGITNLVMFDLGYTFLF